MKTKILSTKTLLVLLVVIFCLGTSLHAGAAAEMNAGQAGSQQWHFRVFVDDREVGTHRFTVEQLDGQQHVRTVADFEYKWSFMTLYDYQHQNHEIWKDGCLARIESSTDANGEDYSVLGEQSDQGFVVNGKNGRQLLPDCVMTFAYWNPQFLSSSQLLNTQDGEYLDVAVTGPVTDVMQLHGQQEPALRYQLKAGKLDLELWYSPGGDWLALQSRTESGRMLRYERMPDAAAGNADLVVLR